MEETGIAVQYRKSVRLPAPVAEVIVDGDEEHAVPFYLVSVIGFR